MAYCSIDGEAFHVHTRRCRHAGEEFDREYIEKAIEMGARRIVFTDHAPFEGDYFDKRMRYEELPEYVATIRQLGQEYKDRIQVLLGLEIEYLPSYREYYEKLKKSGTYDVLVLGQHFYEHERGDYSFDDEDPSMEYVGLCDAMVQGIETGFFDVVAHPDRAFKRRTEWDDDMERASLELIEAAYRCGVYLEMNYSSMQRPYRYWQEFWNLVPKDAAILYGLDAHSTERLAKGWLYGRERFIDA